MSENSFSSIKSWAEDDRPREKLSKKGKSVLSDAELLAILLGSGSRNESALDLAKRILASVDHNLNVLGRLKIADLTRFKGVGEAKAISVITALEIGKRRRLAQALQRKKVTCSSDGFEILQPVLGDLTHEEFWVVFLSNSNFVLAHQCISRGGITGTMADLRLIFKEALNLHATAIILGHNHPSGNLKPSQQDCSLTQRIKEAGQIMDINVLDHLIITEKEYYSFADEGRL